VPKGRNIRWPRPVLPLVSQGREGQTDARLMPYRFPLWTCGPAQ